MPLRYQIDAENGVVLITGSGTISDGDMILCAAGVRSDPDLTPSMPSFIDVRGVKSSVTRSGIYDLVDVMEQTADRRAKAKAALLVDDKLAFGMARMLAALTENVSPEVRVFEDEDAAHVWLGA